MNEHPPCPDCEARSTGEHLPSCEIVKQAHDVCDAFPPDVDRAYFVTALVRLICTAARLRSEAG